MLQSSQHTSYIPEAQMLQSSKHTSYILAGTNATVQQTH